METQPVVSPSHAEEKERLAKLLQNRSDAKELQEKNILKGKWPLWVMSCPFLVTHCCIRTLPCTGGNVAPALQAVQTELQKARLEDKLEGRLERRPDREDLERRGIVSRQASAPSLAFADTWPPPLHQLKDQNVAPALQGKLTELERSQLEVSTDTSPWARRSLDRVELIHAPPSPGQAGKRLCCSPRCRDPQGKGHPQGQRRCVSEAQMWSSNVQFGRLRWSRIHGGRLQGRRGGDLTWRVASKVHDA